MSPRITSLTEEINADTSHLSINITTQFKHVPRICEHELNVRLLLVISDLCTDSENTRLPQFGIIVLSAARGDMCSIYIFIKCVADWRGRPCLSTAYDLQQYASGRGLTSTYANKRRPRIFCRCLSCHIPQALPAVTCSSLFLLLIT